ncbi:hypothetical protein AB5N19_08347 [Seiridium cardinale]|uniref:Uncharacterized protein n=1 Tax=Seiridium cardinale TaxID=138064 RepID=A0ABR2X7G3_9PEZI
MRGLLFVATCEQGGQPGAPAVGWNREAEERGPRALLSAAVTWRAVNSFRETPASPAPDSQQDPVLHIDVADGRMPLCAADGAVTPKAVPPNIVSDAPSLFCKVQVSICLLSGQAIPGKTRPADMAHGAERMGHQQSVFLPYNRGDDHSPASLAYPANVINGHVPPSYCIYVVH